MKCAQSRGVGFDLGFGVFGSEMVTGGLFPFSEPLDDTPFTPLMRPF